MNNSGLFIVQTPYHILLSTTIVKQNKLTEAKIIIFDDFNYTSEYSWLNEYFTEIIVLESKYSINKVKSSFLRKIYERVITVKQIAKSYSIILKSKNKKYKEVFVCNDSQSKVKILASILGKDSIISYIEDGSAAYRSMNMSTNPWNIKDLIRLDPDLLFAIAFNKYKNYNKTKEYGEGDYIKRGYFLHPEFCLDVFRDKEIVKINNELLIDVLESKNKKKVIKDNSIVILAELSSIKQNNNTEEVLKYYLKEKKNIYIKYHPREVNFYLDKFFNENVHKLEVGLSLEEIMIGVKGSIVIGKLSTVFLTLPLMGQNKFICFIDEQDIKNNEIYIKIIKSINVQVICSKDELKSFLS